MSGSVQEDSRHVGATSAPPGPLHQPCSISLRQADEEAALGSGHLSSSQTRPGNALLGSWVAFSDAAQPALPPVPSHAKTAWSVDPEQSLLTAQVDHTLVPAQSIAITTGVPAASSVNASDQSSRSIFSGFPSAQFGSSSGQAVVSPASGQLQHTPVAMSVSQTKGMGGALPKSMRPNQNADFDLLHWGEAHVTGQPACPVPAGAAPGMGFPGSMPGPASRSAMATSMQLPADASCRAMAVRVVGPPCNNTGSHGASFSAATQPSQRLALGTEQAPTWPLAGSSSTHHELQGLEQAVKPRNAHYLNVSVLLDSRPC